jgi:hypothetical protein
VLPSFERIVGGDRHRFLPYQSNAANLVTEPSSLTIPSRSRFT